ncbi:L,D-transpeptidase [Aliiruegeria lutimaris]|uniref:L,D-transpeptidase catalytic domain n=1 Tax=Aliiruegeria lutimaris TaxID=571298 RepID=A0A1G9DKV4_9RHOB|nr:L,D-transpeptidase [Aliiruegeria lutimaris]SDK64496.1 L,D-transpeptidase catalytic domain [Aliiruegeria lutimaris]
MAFRSDGGGGWSRRQTLAGLAGAGILSGLPLVANENDEIVYDIKNMLPGDYTWHPDRSPAGAVAIVVSLPEQKVHVYRNGIRIAVSTCSTGKKGHGTPTGVFTILQKDKDHRSSTYNNAPMPNMNRLTWDGIALHAGKLPGYPASHGCVRLPLEFSEKLFTVTHIGTPVIIAGSNSDPWELTHPGLVLGGTAESEMSAAVQALSAKSHPSDWGQAADYPVTTVMATGADRRIVLIEDGVEILEADLTIDGSPALGEHVMMLTHPRPEDTSLVWHAVTHYPDPGTESLGMPEAGILSRLRAPRDFNSAMRERMHPGMTMIVSDLAATPDRKSGRDFVIMAGENLTSPRPKIRGDQIDPVSPTDDRG